MGVKTERRILEAIRSAAREHARIGSTEGTAAPRIPLHHAGALAESLLAHLRASPRVGPVEIAGDLRRSAETIDQLVVVASSGAPEALIAHAIESPLVAGVRARSARGCSATLVNGMPLELSVVDADAFAVELLYATGSPQHLGQLEARSVRSARTRPAECARYLRAPCLVRDARVPVCRHDLARSMCDRSSIERLLPDVVALALGG
jgi:DNA polymerase/3'-5' exonuclease PolX